ncbi:MAG: AMP-binding protein [Nitrospirota bacterium]|nr:AMP-binding protein [Nitrospirota bacterium]
MRVEEFLELSAERFPDKCALTCGDRRLTYGEIEEKCNHFAHALLAEGVKRGDRVAVCLDNSVEAVLAIFAILKVGAVLMMVNPTTRMEKLTYLLNNSRARVLVTQAKKLAFIEGCWSQTPHLRSIVVAGMDGVDMSRNLGKRFVSLSEVLGQPTRPRHPLPKMSMDFDLAALIYTSGSTGRPKGVMMTHHNMSSAAWSITTYLKNTDEDIIINVLPLSFDYGLYQVLMGFKIGGTVVLERSFTYPHSVLEKIARERVTGFPIVPTISAILLQMDLKKYDFSSLRYITNTGAALPTDHILKMQELLPHVEIYSMYGLTECKRVSYLPPEQIDTRPASVGKGMPGVNVYIVDEEDNRVDPGVIGELVVCGSNVMKGYWGLPEETEKVLKSGVVSEEKVLYTGDLFYMDEEGYLYFVSRKDDIIKTRGEKVSPKEVENVLYSMEGVSEAVVVGVPDEVLGEAVKAVVVPKDGVELTGKDILRYCRDHLEDFMVPKYVEICSALPKTDTGKINRRGISTP